MSRAVVPCKAPLDWHRTDELFGRMVLLLDQAANQQAKFLTMKQAALYTGLSVTFLRRLIAAGKLVAIRDGRLKVRKSDLDGLIGAPDIAAWYTSPEG